MSARTAAGTAAATDLPGIERPVVVGVDDSAGAELALRWAQEDAAARGVPLRVVHAYRWRFAYDRIGTPGGSLGGDLQRAGHDGEQFVAQLLDRARAAAPRLPIGGEAIAGRPAAVLLDEAAGAGVLVLGSRRLTAISSEVFGSVGAAVAARASCPAVVVRGVAGPPEEGAAVVVGVDATPASERVLHYAFEHASRHRAALRAVLCWHPDLLATMRWRPEPPPPERAEAWLSECLAGWRERFPDVPVHPEVLREHPTDGLISASLSQHLLVVGRHGRSAAAGTLLGSVSQGVLHHADCPVALVPTG
ncbi:MAG TPA: universal stress protein [Jatrophihabitans sp.]|nr:universal stress protein [Jatrophihabitans sp.]